MKSLCTYSSHLRNLCLHSLGARWSPVGQTWSLTAVRIARVDVHTERFAPHLRAQSLRRSASHHLVNAAAEEACCQQCTITPVPRDKVDLLSDILLGEGATAVSVEEHRADGEDEEEIFADGERRLWASCSVQALFPMEKLQHKELRFAAQAPVAEHMRMVEQYTGQSWQYSLLPVLTQQWAQAIKDSYQPIAITQEFSIIPAWHSAAQQPLTPGATAVILEPGLAFGTGDHPTTQLCLRWLLDHRPLLEGNRVMDYGMGSGVLAISALLFGAECAVGTDVDPLSVRAAVRNADLNEVSSKLTALQCLPTIQQAEPLAAAGLPNRTFDVVIANILRGPLLELCPRLLAYVKPGGHIVLSGILESQVPAVRAAYGPACDDVEVTVLGQWALLAGRVRS